MDSPASLVIARFGGQSALARLIGKNQSTVQHWVSTGTIPAKWHRELLRLAGEKGVSLRPEDLIMPGQPQAEKPALPIARWPGTLEIGQESVPCYVLDDGRRVISRTGATSYLSGKQGQGSLETYLRVEALQGFLPGGIGDQMVAFIIPEVTHKEVRGITAETFLEICTAYVLAREAGSLQTDRQVEIARQAALFLAACSKVGLIALIDEATGYQYERAEEALQIKLRLFLADEMRGWEKTFPDELWREFGRLTGWQGSVQNRPKYWGHLVNEMVYQCLDPDVFTWLKTNAPKPRHGQNYHQWMSEQYGLKKLSEHIWMLIGMASTCQTMGQLRQMMADRLGVRASCSWPMWTRPCDDLPVFAPRMPS